MHITVHLYGAARRRPRGGGDVRRVHGARRLVRLCHDDLERRFPGLPHLLRASA
ncbi:hypothetical protein ABT297_24835 [Dactylosporangium sp. NPDC000555]|uniref:hypothetical protein n=1 Tax=Dactylosporangium sp. NPDC000555 TaxID=3154260 RepID=UPI00331B74DA